MKAVITVLGADKAGIIAAVTTTMAEHGVNVLSIEQTIVDGIFNMIMICELQAGDNELLKVQDALAITAKEIGVQIKAQHMAIFESMHRVD